MSTGDEVCSGWLIKSPPERKLKRYAWRKRWFVLRRGRMSGDADVLEYYRTRSSRKPIRSIDLHECEVQMQAEVCVLRRELQGQHLFAIKTSSRIYYLVAKSKEEMNCWVCNISEICHLSPLSPAELPQNSPELSPSSSAPSNAPPADTSTAEDSRSEPCSESSPLPDYLVLSQCETGRLTVNRCDSWSNSETSVEQNSAEDVFLSPLCSSHTLHPFMDMPLSAPHSFSHPSKIFPPSNIFLFENAASCLSLAAESGSTVPPPRPPKPRRLSERGVEENTHYVKLRSSEGHVPRRVSLAGLDHICREELDINSERIWKKRLSLNLPPVTHTTNPSTYSEDSYVPMSTGASPPGSSSDGYISMSPTSSKIRPPSEVPETPPPSTPPPAQHSDLEPPPVNRDLKPRRRLRPPPLDLRGLSTIRECPSHLPLVRTLTEPSHSATWLSLDRSRTGEPENSATNVWQMDTVPPHFPGKSSLDYLSLDFNSAAPSPVQKKALMAEEQRVDYVQVDKQKTQALQNTKMDWRDFRQSKE